MMQAHTLTDEYFMYQALVEAQKAAVANEVPVGAVVVCNGTIIGAGYNQLISHNNPSAHAEIIALQQAGQYQQNYRLPGCQLYVTLEPCTMCVGAMIHARIERLIFATREPKAGAVVSQLQLLYEPHFNHIINVHEGVLAEEASQVLTQFFQNRRKVKQVL